MLKVKIYNNKYFNLVIDNCYLNLNIYIGIY